MRKYIYSIVETLSFMQSLTYRPHIGDILYEKDLKTTKRIMNNSEEDFNIIAVMKDWIEIRNRGITYWFKWKNGSYVLPNRLLYDL